MTAEGEMKWRRLEELRPDELSEIVLQSPVAFWPLGLLEHHGWHLPVGYDGIKAQRICARVADRTGGVLLPTMWWGGGGGHDSFKWTFYQSEEAASSILVHTVEKLIEYGFSAIVLLAGHYPWRGWLDRHVPPHCRKVSADPSPLGNGDGDLWRGRSGAGRPRRAGGNLHGARVVSLARRPGGSDGGAR